MKLLLAFSIALTLASGLAAQEKRIASDYDIAEARKQVERGNAIGRIAGHLNLGDAYSTRNQTDVAEKEYRLALSGANAERVRTRKASDLAGYARATAYAGLANAKLGNDSDALSLFDEATRYVADSASTWNLYASAMLVAGRNHDAAAVARNAVRIAEADSKSDPSPATSLDLDVYRYTLASALGNYERDEAARLLDAIIASLASPRFDAIRSNIGKDERFEVLSSTSGDEAAYLSLMLRSRLKRAALAEAAGDVERARSEYRAVLAQRTDDPTALTALARLSTNADERQRNYADAFAANPYSLPLIREYATYLERGGTPASAPGDGAGDRVRAAVEAMARRDYPLASSTLRTLLASDPHNDALLYLAARAAILAGNTSEADSYSAEIRSAAVRSEVRRGVAPFDRASFFRWLSSSAVVDANESQVATLVRITTGDTLTPEERSILDRAVIRVRVAFDNASEKDGSTILSGGTVGTERIRFSTPTAFRGHFDANVPLLLEARVLGASRDDNGAYLLVEPLGVTR